MSDRDAAFKLLAARILEATDNRVGILREGIAALEASGVVLLPEQRADLFLLANLQQDAMEKLAEAYLADPSATRFAHRLGLGELARALRTPAVATDLAVERWTRVLAYLGVAIADREYWSAWCASRSAVYSAELRPDDPREAARAVVHRLRQFILHQADAAEAAKELRTATALRSLAAEWEVDRAAVAAAEESVEAMPASSLTAPFPFGPIWFRTMGAPPASAIAIASAVTAGEWAKYEPEGRPADRTAPTHGARLRQWFSRLAPVRMAISNGQLPAAKLALDRLCASGPDCQPTTTPKLPFAIGSPKTCDPDCVSFAKCNPGYAKLADPGRSFETDAHRLAVRVALATAAAHARAEPPRFIEAAQFWVRGRVLSDVIGESEEYSEAVVAQVLGLLGEFRGQPEVETVLLKAASDAVPGDLLRGRLVDRLTDRAIDRGNADRWEESVADLQAALRLNRFADRARANLGFALKQLATLHHNKDRHAIAQQTLQELIDFANEPNSPGAEHKPWAEYISGRWPKSDDEDPLDEILKRHGKG